MSATVLVRNLAAVLSALKGTGGSPESTLYTALGSNLDEWGTVKRAGISLGWIDCRNHYVTLTTAGREKADEIDALLASK